jgi:head-tail adaptor
VTIRAGELDRQVTIVRRVAGPRDAGGAPTIVWTDQDPIWAKRTDVSDGERFRSQGVAATLKARFTVRAEDGDGVGAKDRIRDEDAGETFDVVGVKRLGFEALEITAGTEADG